MFMLIGTSNKVRINSNLETMYSLAKFGGAIGYLAFDIVTVEDTICLKVIVDGVNAFVIKGDLWVDV